MAWLKLPITPRRVSFRRSVTGHGAFGANVVSSAHVPSVDASSQITISSGGRDCARMLSSCSARNRSPLHVHIAIDTRMSGTDKYYQTMAATQTSGPVEPRRVVRIITRLNVGGPAH